MNNRNILKDGRDIHTQFDFHRIFAEFMDFSPYYGSNLDALWDRLITDIERPVIITWGAFRIIKKDL